MSFFRVKADAVEIDIQVVPRASRTRVVGVLGDRLKVQISSPPVDGAANEALIEFMAVTLAVKRSEVSIARGETSKKKCLRITGLDPRTAAEKLAALGSTSA